MSRHNRSKHRSALPPQPQLSNPAGVGVVSKVEASLLSRDVFKGIFEQALDLARTAPDVDGTIGPRALFIYTKSLRDEERNDSAMKFVSISWKNELHKEVVRMRIHEKAEQEGASAVALVMPAETSDLHERRSLISGATPHLRADASVTYTFDKATKTFIFSEIAWRDEPVSSFFLEGIFGASGKTKAGVTK
jgi:hypothetical protein